MKTIAVGVGSNKNILNAIESFNNVDIDFQLIYKDKNLFDSILNPEIDATIRGSLPSSGIIKNLKSKFKNVFRATYVKDDENEFLLAPVGIDDGDSITNKLEIAIECGNFFKMQGKEPKIAVLAEGREGDYGRSNRINKSIDNSNKLTTLIEEQTQYNVENYYILFEKAIADKYNVLIAPDGVFGNVLFRSLVLVNSWSSYGAITFGLPDIFIDTSRDQSVQGYIRSIILAEQLINLKKGNHNGGKFTL